MINLRKALKPKTVEKIEKILPLEELDKIQILFPMMVCQVGNQWYTTLVEKQQDILPCDSAYFFFTRLWTDSIITTVF